MTEREIERERLIELLNNSLTGSVGLSSMLSESIADYLLANGVTVPPCKVGDTVYQTDKVQIYESKIKNVIYDTTGIAFSERAIGKTVFLTREEAEKALKEKGTVKDEKASMETV